MSLREFTEYGAGSRNRLTLRVNQTLFISNTILLRQGIANTEAVIIYVEEDANILRIGIEFLKKFDEDRKSCKKILKEKSGISFNLSSILRFYGINKLKEKVFFEIKNQGNIIILDLEKLKNI